MLWITVIMLLMAAVIIWFFTMMAKVLYAETFRNSLYTTDEYAERVFSDVEVAVHNNIKAIEMRLERPDLIKQVMAGMVRDNRRIRSCGVSFVENYYPNKGRLFCPYAWRDDNGLVKTAVLNKVDNDYLNSEWFRTTVEKNESRWGDPFIDGHQSKNSLVAYLVPIHDREGNVVAVLGADLALGWLGDKLREADSLTIENSLFKQDENDLTKSVIYSTIINRNGTYISHPREDYVLKGNFFNHVTHERQAVVDSICGAIAAGENSEGEIVKQENLIIDGREGYLFFRPMQHDNWVIATFVDTSIISNPAIGIGIILVIILLITLLIIQIVSRLAANHVTKPLRQLALSVDEVAKGNFDTPLPQLKHNDEIKLLRDSFENMQRSLSDYVAEIRENTAQRSAIESELNVAHKIQASLLPKVYPPFPERTDIDIYGMQTPAKAVGGDLFDFHIRSGRLFFCIGDVSGKGIPASIIMAMTRTLFRNVSARVVRPETIASVINEAICDNNDNNMFVTLFIGVLHLDSGLLEYCNAGHNAPLLIGTGVEELPMDSSMPVSTKVEELPVWSNLPIGVMPDWTFKSQQIHIEQETTVFLYTDGLNEAENADHEQFGDERVMEIARHCAPLNMKAQTLIAQMTGAVHAFVNGAEQSDDLTMLAVKYTPSPANCAFGTVKGSTVRTPAKSKES